MKFIINLLAFLIVISITQAQPTNDNCSGAITLIPSSTCTLITGSTIGATQSFPSACSGSLFANANDDVWYKFVATDASPKITVNSTLGTSTDIVVELLSDCSDTTVISCEDQGIVDEPEVLQTSGLIIGQTYYLRIYDYSNSTGGNFSVCVQSSTTSGGNASNDTPCSAIQLSGITSECEYNEYTLQGATASSGMILPGCGWQASYKDVWFKVVIPTGASSKLAVNTFGDVSHVDDGVIALYKGSCSALTYLICNDDFKPTGSGVSLDPVVIATGLVAGDTVFIRYSPKADPKTKFQLCVTTPDNDDCDQAKYVCDLGVGYGGTTSAAYTIDKPGNMHGTGENGYANIGPFGIGQSPLLNDVTIQNNSWIRFTAGDTTATISVAITNCLRNLGVQMQVFRANNIDCKIATYTPVSSFKEGLSTYNLNLTGLVIGSDYFLMVDGYAGDLCNYTLTATSGIQPAGITTAGNDTIICVGESITLDGIVDTRVTGYNWINTSETTSSITVSPTITTTYSLEVTGLCGNKKAASLIIYVDSVKTVDITGTLIGCPGNSYTYNVPNNAGYVYNWQATNGTITSGQGTNDATISWDNSAANETITLNITSQYGCTKSITKNVVLKNPTIPAMTYSNNDSICFGQSTTFNVLVAEPNVTYTFYDALTGGNVVGNPPLMVTPPANTDYYLEVVNQYGCKATPARAKYTVHVIDLPTIPSVLFFDNDSLLCKGQSTIISISSSAPGVSYSLYADAPHSLFVSYFPYVTPPLTNDTTYYIQAVNSFGCKSTTANDAVTIVVYPTPEPPLLTSPNNPICAEQRAQLSAVSTTAGATLYWLSAPDGEVLHAGNSFVSDPLTVNTTYYVSVTSKEGCVNKEGMLVVPVIVKALPKATLISDAVDNTIYAGQLIRFTASPSNYEAYTFYVDVNQVQSSVSNMYSSTTIENGQLIKVKVLSNGCENWADDSIKVKVKPISNAFTPNGDGKNDVFLKGLDISIYNRWGQKLYEGKDGWDGRYNGSLVSPGTYYYIVRLMQLGSDEVKTLNGPVTVIED